MKIKIKIDDIWYEWFGGFGSLFQSYENNIKKGDVRYIKNRLYYVFSVNKTGWFSKNRVSWGICKKVSAEDIRDIKKEFFI